MKKLLLTILFLFLIFPVFAQSNYQEDLDKVENYFNNLEYFSASFNQKDFYDQEASGKFYLSRPGKLKIDYQIPNKLIITTNNRVTAYYDVELDEVSQIRTKKTPIYFLVKKDFSFKDKDVVVLSVNKKDSLLEITLTQKNKEDLGKILLKFLMKDDAISLQGIKIFNELEEGIDITFSNISLDDIDKKVFKLDNISRVLGK